MHARKRRQKYYAQLDARSRARAGGSNPKILLSELETFKSLCGGEGGEEDEKKEGGGGGSTASLYGHFPLIL